MRAFFKNSSLFVFLFLNACSPFLQKQNLEHSSVTLVQSYPVETTLKSPDLPEAHDVWVRMIDQSQRTIEIEQMYADGKTGELLDTVIEALERASNRGVKIRFLLSKKMFSTNAATLEALQKIRNLELRAVDFGALTGGIQHAKFWIFDHSSVFVGSQNFDWKSLTHILEMGVLIRDDLISKQLLSIFDLDWEMAKTGRAPLVMPIAPKTPENCDVYLVAAPPALNPKNIDSSLDELMRLLKLAQSSVKVTLLDFSSYLYGQSGEWRDLENELVATAARGVNVKLLVSHWNTEKPEIETIKRLSLAKNIEVKISTIPENASGWVPYSRVNHGKMMMIDGSTLWVGTSNWSRGYFTASRGIEFVMKRKDLTQQGEAIFDQLWNQPYTEYVDVSRNYPKPRK